MIGNDKQSAETDSGGETTIHPDSDLILKSTDLLLSGDVLLYRPSNPSIVQQRISSVTNSPYTHAAIYVGDGIIAESVVPAGVTETPLTHSMDGNLCIAVLRSQYVFSDDRPQKLRKFVDAVLACRKLYNFIDVLKFPSQSGAYFNNQLDFIRDNYGKVTSHNEFAEMSFFCSAFVVACYSVVGIIGDTAQVAYQPENFSPGHLHHDPTFGWLLGFLVPKGGSVPKNDPVLVHATHWHDLMSERWW